MSAKKLLFAPLFLSFLVILSYLFRVVLNKHLDIFFGAWGGLYEVGLIAIVMILASLTYCLYVTFTQDIKYYLVLAILGSLTAFTFLKPSLAIVAGIGFFVSLSIVYFTLLSNLKTYINFQPVNLLSSPIKTLNTLLLLSLTLVFYFHSNSIIQTQGFKIPEPIIDWAIDLSMQDANIPVRGEKYLAQLPTISQDQLDLLKQNPQVLEQFGINPADLDAITPSTQTQSPVQSTLQNIPGVNLRDAVKSQINASLDQVIKPYLFAIPMFLAFLFYSLGSFVLWILSIFLSPTILLIFSILEKSGFIRFDKEMREVKKIVI